MDGYEFDKAELDALERVLGDATAEPIPLSLPLLKHITNDFSQETEIGRGGYAVVYLGTLPNGSRVAVKKMSDSISESAFHNEVRITIKAAHKNIVRFIGYCADVQGRMLKYDAKLVMADFRNYLMCMEYVPNQTLDRYITDMFHGLDWNQRYQILKGICQALSYLHDEVRVIHGDIKPSNVLLEDNFMPKVFDFGLSMCLGEGEDSYRSEDIRGTLGYLAPESFGGRTTFKTDIYSLGVTIVELLTGMKGYYDVDDVLRYMRKELVKRGVFSSWENKYQQVRTCLEIGIECIEPNPDKRPTASEIIRLLDETECTNDSGSTGHAPPFWQDPSLLQPWQRTIGSSCLHAGISLAHETMAKEQSGPAPAGASSPLALGTDWSSDNMGVDAPSPRSVHADGITPLCSCVSHVHGHTSKSSLDLFASLILNWTCHNFQVISNW